ncbi:hypothetical protein SKAU_G00154880 [Synaphobranchus kaupii]|uniref:Uncharacterized protein n=1 Tax=Synaphobranchus kaupii TaxID=118154 RepID=A0A9Q1FHI8_SYNKA|nr:hypothetical protein SKAU_G00154880 [Synaphobranchus kaupii]
MLEFGHWWLLCERADGVCAPGPCRRSRRGVKLRKSRAIGETLVWDDSALIHRLMELLKYGERKRVWNNVTAWDLTILIAPSSPLS